MAQIPLFNQSQRLDPSTPSQAVSPEGSAGAMQGRALQEFGNAMFRVGNTLDVAAKSTKAAEDKLESKALEGAAGDILLQLKNQFAAEAVNLKDNPNGNDSVDRLKKAFAEQMEPVLDGASSDTVRRLVTANIADNVITTSAQISVAELDKREKNLVLSRQENLNTKAHLARSNYAVTQISAAEWESDILQDDKIPDSQKSATIAGGVKYIVEEGIWGIVDAAKSSPNSTGASFNAALSKLESDGALVFTGEEKRKLENAIRSQKSEYFSSLNNMKSAEEREYKLDIEMRDDKAVYTYSQQMNAAGTDGARMAVVLAAIDKDPFLTAPSRRSLKADRKNIGEYREDLYTAKFQEDLYLGRMNTNSLLKRLKKDANNGDISPNKWVELQRKVTEKQDSDRTNPGLTGVVSAAKNEIQAAFGSDAFDFDTKMYKGQAGKVLAQAESDFSVRVARLHANKDYSEASVTAAKRDVLSKFGRSQPDLSKITTGLGTLTDIPSATDALKALDEDLKVNGTKWDASTRKVKKESLSETAKQLKYLQDQQKLKTEIKPKTNSKKAVGD